MNPSERKGYLNHVRQQNAQKRQLPADELYPPRLHFSDISQDQASRINLLTQQRALLKQLPRSEALKDIGQDAPGKQDKLYNISQGHAVLVSYQNKFSEGPYLFTIGISPCVGLVLEGQAIEDSQLCTKGSRLVLLAHLDSDFYGENPAKFYEVVKHHMQIEGAMLMASAASEPSTICPNIKELLKVFRIDQLEQGVLKHYYESHDFSCIVQLRDDVVAFKFDPLLNKDWLLRANNVCETDGNGASLVFNQSGERVSPHDHSEHRPRAPQASSING